MNYAVAGDSTAVADTDYTALSGTVTIEIGETQAVVNVVPIDNLTFDDGDRTVKVHLTSGGYQIGSQSNGVVTIHDDEDTITNYYSRMKITFSGYTQDETLTNFPALVKLGTQHVDFAWSQFADPVNGSDLRFSDADGTTVLPYEVESWSNAADGISYVWVRVPELTQDGHIWAYWGNETVTSAPPAYTTNGATWSEGYVVVHHLSETGGTTAADSSTNAYHGTLQNMAGTEWEAAVLGNGLRFDGGEDYYSLPDISSHFTDDDATLTMWVKKDVHADNRPLVHLGNDDGNNQHYPYNDGIHIQTWRNNTVSWTTLKLVGSVTLTDWHMVSVSSELGGSWRFYQNALQAGSVAAQAFPVPTTPYIGRYPGSPAYYDGMFDEVRIANVARSAD